MNAVIPAQAASPVARTATLVAERPNHDRVIRGRAVPIDAPDASELEAWLMREIAKLNEASRPRDVGSRFIAYDAPMTKVAFRAVFPALVVLNLLCATIAFIAPLISTSAGTAGIEELTYAAAVSWALILAAMFALSRRRAFWLLIFAPAAILWPSMMLIATL